MRISGWSSDVCSSDLGGAGAEALDGHAQLHPGEVRAEAPVDAAPEGEVPVALPVDDELVGSLEVLGVAVARGERHQALVALLPRAAGVLGVLGEHPKCVV